MNSGLGIDLLCPVGVLSVCWLPFFLFLFCAVFLSPRVDPVSAVSSLDSMEVRGDCIGLPHSYFAWAHVLHIQNRLHCFPGLDEIREDGASQYTPIT